MSFPTVASLEADLSTIEAAIDDGSYQKGPWARFMRESALLEPEARRPLVDAVSRISDKLHTFNRPDAKRFSLRKGLIAELVLLFGAIADIILFLWLDWPIAVWISTYALCTAAQPLFKMMVGTLLGVKYSHFWLWIGIEPRVKMQYGTYLVLPMVQRVILHLAGTVGSAAAFLVVGYTIGPWQPTNAIVCLAVGWFFVALNASFFVLGYFGVGSLRRTFSGGAAAAEIIRHRKVKAMRAQLQTQAAA